MPLITPVKKSDLPILAQLYKLAFNSMGDKRTDESALKMLEYRYPKKIKIKITVDNKIIWACFVDIKPLYFGNILFDWDLFIDPKYQKHWYGKDLFLHAIIQAKKKYKVVWRDFFTFKDWFQSKRYEKMWFNVNQKRCMMTWNVDEVIGDLTYPQNMLKKS